MVSPILRCGFAFVESPHDFCAVHWDHEPRQLVGRGVLTAPRLGVLGTARPTLWFMESPLSFFRMHWDHELVRGTSPVWSPGFSRSKSFEPPKGGTPNQPRFMERVNGGDARCDCEPRRYRQCGKRWRIREVLVRQGKRQS